MGKTTNRAVLASLSAIFLTCGLAISEARATILPKNDLHLQDRLTNGNITEQQFNEISDKIVEMWKPLAKLHGAELTVEKRWRDSTVNAYANQQGNQWRVHMFGGLARRPEVTADGFALVVCHELGHHFGGYAFHEGTWAASEGQSDYWATQTCARRIWGKSLEKNAALVRKSRPHLADACDSVWKTPDEKNLCARVTEAGLSLAKLLGALGGEVPPRIDTRDKSEVKKTNTAHPRAQCRLDTYLHGALCTQSFDLKIIPGKHGDSNSNTAEAELESARYSCMERNNFKVGYRPRCWFKEINSPFHRLGSFEEMASN